MFTISVSTIRKRKEVLVALYNFSSHTSYKYQYFHKRLIGFPKKISF